MTWQRYIKFGENPRFRQNILRIGQFFPLICHLQYPLTQDLAAGWQAIKASGNTGRHLCVLLCGRQHGSPPICIPEDICTPNKITCFRYCRNEKSTLTLHPKSQRVVSDHVNPVVFMRLGHKATYIYILWESQHSYWLYYAWHYLCPCLPSKIPQEWNTAEQKAKTYATASTSRRRWILMRWWSWQEA